jgi:hypothetical protein
LVCEMGWVVGGEWVYGCMGDVWGGQVLYEMYEWSVGRYRGGRIG